jgi:dipeptidyl aminopeptidase/acylaminoacyl peptidase
LKGLLLKPENFDPKKKYPMIVYIYERLTQGLHQFRNRPGTSINPTFYVSNGYLILCLTSSTRSVIRAERFEVRVARSQAAR